MKNVTEKHPMCPTCATNKKDTKLELKQINFDCALYLCPRKKCKYPQGHPWLIVNHSYEDLCKLVATERATKNSTSIKKKIKEDHQDTLLKSVLMPDTTITNNNDYHNILNDLNNISPDLAATSLHDDNIFRNYIDHTGYVETNVYENGSNKYAECIKISHPEVGSNIDASTNVEYSVAQNCITSENSQNTAFTQHVEYMKSDVNSSDGVDIAAFLGYELIDDYGCINQDETLMLQNGNNQLVPIDESANNMNDIKTDILNFLPSGNEVEEYVEGADTMDLDEFDQLLQ